MSVTLLGRRALAELVGTGGLAVAVVGSGIAAQRLSPGQPGLELLENSLATGIALAVLIAVLQPVSAAFNPVVTLAERVLGQVTTRHALLLIAAQLVGALAGTMVANLMFGLPAVTVSDHTRGGAGLWLGETVATAGLIMVIFGAVRTGRTRQLGYLVGGYIAAGLLVHQLDELRQPRRHPGRAPFPTPSRASPRGPCPCSSSCNCSALVSGSA